MKFHVVCLLTTLISGLTAVPLPERHARSVTARAVPEPSTVPSIPLTPSTTTAPPPPTSQGPTTPPPPTTPAPPTTPPPPTTPAPPTTPPPPPPPTSPEPSISTVPSITATPTTTTPPPPTTAPPTTPSTTTTTTTTTQGPTTPSQPAHTWYTGGDCGKTKYNGMSGVMSMLGFTIVGGQETLPNEYPWQLAMYETDPLDVSVVKLTCGASIINKNWVMTAAHCVDMMDDPGTGRTYFLRGGEHDTSTIEGPEITRFYMKSDVHIHELWDRYELINDIALIKVQVPFAFNDNIQPVCPPTPPTDYTGADIVIAGWGRGNYAFPDLSPVLQSIDMKVINNVACKNLFARAYITFLEMPHTVFCAIDEGGNTERSSCQGDSGGPLVFKNTNNCYEQVGIVSFGFGCAYGLPAGHTRVAAYMDWIQSHIVNDRA